MDTEKSRKIFIIIGIFSLILLLEVMVLHLLLPDKAYSETEKRGLTQLPAFSWEALFEGKLTEHLNDYASDQFPARSSLMKVRMNLSRYLGKRESNGVFYGKGGVLIEEFAEADMQKCADTAGALNDFIATHEFENEWILLSPTAVSVYPERLPLSAVTGDESAWRDAFLSQLSPELEVLDTDTVYEEMKAEGTEIFYATDHHWRTETAYRVFLENAEACGWTVSELTEGVVNNRFSGSLASKSGFTPARYDELGVYLNEDEDLDVLVTQAFGDYESFSGFYAYDKLDSANPYEVFLGGNDPVLRISTTADTNRTLLVLKDSYANCFIPFLADSYKTICVIDPRYSANSIDTILSDTEYTDLLVLYNTNTLSQDDSLQMILEQ